MCLMSPIVFEGRRTTLLPSRFAIRLLKILKYCCATMYSVAITPVPSRATPHSSLASSPCAMISNDFFSASAAISFAAASPCALTIIEARMPSAFSTCYPSLTPLSLTRATLPRLVITSRIRSPSARRTSDLPLMIHSHTHLLERSLLICFSITFLMSLGGRIFWISTRVIVTPHRSASKWIFVSSSIHAVYLFQQLRVDRFSRREGVIQSDLGNNVTKRSLR